MSEFLITLKDLLVINAQEPEFIIEEVLSNILRVPLLQLHFLNLLANILFHVLLFHQDSIFHKSVSTLFLLKHPSILDSESEVDERAMKGADAETRKFPLEGNGDER